MPFRGECLLQCGDFMVSPCFFGYAFVSCVIQIRIMPQLSDSKSLHDFSTVFSFLSIFLYTYILFFSCVLCSVLLGLKICYPVKDAATRCQVYMFQSARYLWFGHPCVLIRFLLHLCFTRS